MKLIKHGNVFEWQDAFKNVESVLPLSEIDGWKQFSNESNLDEEESIVGRGLEINRSFDVYEEISKAFNICLDEYISTNKLSITKDNMASDTFLLREYHPGSKLHLHQDWHGPKKKNGELQRVYLTAILYFNENFEGGELNFPDDDLCYRPKTGSLLIFPSTTNHEVLKLISGKRYLTSVYIYENPISFYDKPNI